MAAAIVAGQPAVAGGSGKWSWMELPRWLLSSTFRQLQAVLTGPNQLYGQAFLDGNFAPVTEEVFSRELPAVGALPKELQGVFLRIGPNPQFTPLGGYHWFDGDGMLHATRIKGGTASYCNHWVRTSRFNQEATLGWPVFEKLGDHVGFTGLAIMLLRKVKQWLGLTYHDQGGGTANTALVAHASKLLALHEGDLPYAVRILCNGLMETIGRVTFGGKLTKNFTAHPKVDPETGKLHFFWYKFDAAPYVTYGCLSKEGALEATLPLDVRHPIMMHDFAITANHAVFMELPLCFDGQRMVKEKNVPFRFRPELGARMGLLPLGAKEPGAMRWFNLPAFMAFHVANAWEEKDGTVQLLACYHESITLDLDVRCKDGVPRGEQPRLARITLKPDSTDASLTVLTNVVGDFPTINPTYTGRRCRYAYVATMFTKGVTVKFNGVAKIDLQAAGIDQEVEEGVLPPGDGVVGRVSLPEGCYSGEAVFVPRFEDPKACKGEDDGFLLTYVHNESSGVSSLYVWDAHTMASTPLATVALPHRVPYGFHALFMNETQVQQQLAIN